MSKWLCEEGCVWHGEKAAVTQCLWRGEESNGGRETVCRFPHLFHPSQLVQGFLQRMGILTGDQ